MNFEYSNFLQVIDDLKKFNIDQSKVCSKDIFSLITHAHTDHVCNTPQITYTTEENIDLLNVKLPRNKFDFRKLKYNKPIMITDNISLTPLNAGHILGSTMFYLENKNKSVLYTGDFNYSSSLLLKSAKAVNADILITETTFGRPEFKFKQRSVIYTELANQIEKDIKENKFVIIGGYSLGKNQELISFVNNYLNIVPLVDHETFKFSEIYNKYNHNLKFELLDHNIYKSNILIMPISLVNRNFLNSLRLQLGKTVSSYVMSGWNFSRGSNLVHISDHSDFESLLDFVNDVNPKKVFTMHGFSKEFAKHIENKLNIPATTIDNISQKSLLDFI